MGLYEVCVKLCAFVHGVCVWDRYVCYVWGGYVVCEWCIVCVK